MKKTLVCIYAIVQLAAFVLFPVGLFLRNPVCLYAGSAAAGIAFIFLVCFLALNKDKK